MTGKQRSAPPGLLAASPGAPIRVDRGGATR